MRQNCTIIQCGRDRFFFQQITLSKVKNEGKIGFFLIHNEIQNRVLSLGWEQSLGWSVLSIWPMKGQCFVFSGIDIHPGYRFPFPACYASRCITNRHCVPHTLHRKWSVTMSNCSWNSLVLPFSNHPEAGGPTQQWNGVLRTENLCPLCGDSL